MSTASPSNQRSQIRWEAAWLIAFLFLGLVLLPVAVYVVGIGVFGDYEPDGFAGFFGEFSSEFRSGQPAVVFLILSPYLIWLLCRLTYWAYQRSKLPN